MSQRLQARPRRSARSSPSLGSWPGPEGTNFRVWAPKADEVEVVVESEAEDARSFPLRKGADGTFEATFPEVRPGDRYRYLVDGRGPFPDPASRFQPEGVHGPSEVVDPGRFAWTDGDWKGTTPEDLVVYEIHVGTFSPEGTFAGVSKKLEALRDVGVTAIELMPIAEFAGDRSWGYDGVGMFAPSRSYGSPEDLRKLVNEAHALGIAVLLDVVYNHFGPVGNYTLEFSDQYLSQRESAWAACVNLDAEGSDQVRDYFIENALHWLREYHIDGLRLDATHALHDDSSPNFLQELVARVREAFPDRWIPLIAEDHRNLDAMIRPPWAGGWGLDGVWADDFHHEVRRLLAGDNEAYFRDFAGTTEEIATTINQGWFYTGEHSIHMDEDRGTDPVGIEPRRFVICLQNHDQVGNRAFGDRLHHQIDLAAYRAASALLLGAPQTPLLFNGQEWAASAPFLYFTDHDEDLGKIVTEGRRREFRHFLAFVDPEAREKIPDPQALSTFEKSRLDWSEVDREPHASTWRLYRALLALRRSEPALRSNRPDDHEAVALDDDTVLLSHAGEDGSRILVLVRLRNPGEVALPEEGTDFETILSTEDPEFASDSAPIAIDRGGPSLRVRFERPGALFLKASKTEVNGDR